MNRQEWRELQRALHPADLETVQDLARCLLSDRPFVFAYDGRLSRLVEGPGVQPLAADVARVIEGVGVRMVKEEANGQPMQ